MQSRFIILAGLIGFGLAPSTRAGGDYARDVKPILTARCASCHGAIRQKAGLRLDASQLIRRGGDGGPAVVPGKPDESPLIDRVASTDNSERMPPPSEGVPLNAEEIGILKAWIVSGAEAPTEKVPENPRKHWSYQPPQRPAIPASASRAFGNPIDAFLDAGRRAKGLVGSPPAGKEIWLRRIYLDLIGLPPTRDELHAFRADDSPAAREKVAGRLLADPRHGERWGRHWMDVWRYSDWYGLGMEQRYSHAHIWHWRDWIVEAINADKGYDRMILEMLAGDELAPGDDQISRATGFLVRNWDIFNRNKWLESTVEHTSRAFLGVTLQCARCHDHKFDPISQADYYRFRAVFEPHHIRIDRVPGQPDRLKDGIPRVFDDYLETPTYLFVRGDENQPAKDKPIGPGVPAVLTGELRVSKISLSATDASPDKRPFIIAELRAGYEQAVTKARGLLDAARLDAAAKGRALATAEEADRKASEALAKADDPSGKKATNAREPAIESILALVSASSADQEAKLALGRAERALAIAEAKRDEQAAVLEVEAIEDQSEARDANGAWGAAARKASGAQRILGLLEATNDRDTIARAADRARKSLEGLASVSLEPNDKTLDAVRKKAATELVVARAQLSAAEGRLAKAEQEATKPISTAYLPRPLVHHRAKTTFTEVPSNAPYPKVSTGRRLALARWIADRKNPLTARVAVNHIWARHFGEPLVPSMFDLGLRTERPVQHELLDWLAVELMESGWDMKRLHRLIVTSDAYAMQSTGGRLNEQNAKLDPDNHYLWRMNTRRMEGEVVRDSILQLGGNLDARMGGADIPVAQADRGDRRTIYYRYARQERVTLLTPFDAASIEECYRRSETVIPQQALALMNSGMVMARAGEIAQVINREVGDADTPEARVAFVESAFEWILGRVPTLEERSECERAMVGLRDLFASQESPQGAPSHHVRARGGIVHILLNHNDFVTIR